MVFPLFLLQGPLYTGNVMSEIFPDCVRVTILEQYIVRTCKRPKYFFELNCENVLNFGVRSSEKNRTLLFNIPL